MPIVLTSDDYDEIAKRVAKIMLQHRSSTGWIGLRQFTDELPVRKAPEWVRFYILRGKPWAVNVNPGKGHATRINEKQGLRWIDQHQDEIDWRRKLP